MNESLSIKKDINNKLDILRSGPFGNLRKKAKEEIIQSYLNKVNKNAVAFVIGIEDYLNVYRANYATNDAKTISRYLKNMFGMRKKI